MNPNTQGNSQAPSGLPSYEEESRAKQQTAVRLACRLAAALTLGFVLLDPELVRPGLFPWVLGVRLVAAGVMLGVARALRRPRRRVLAWAMVGLAAAVVPLPVVALASGGLHSPYLFAALVHLGALSALFPLPARQLAWLQAEVIGLALLPLAGQVHQAPLTFLVAACFLGALALVGLAGASVSEGLRRREYQARCEASRQASLAQLGQVAGGLAHELSQPLTSVSLELARLDGHPGEELSPRSLDRLNRGVVRMRQILLAMRQGARAPDGQLQPVDLPAQAELALTLVEPQLGGVAVGRELEEVPEVLGQPTLLGQVLVNLLVNAADALRGHPAPRVVVRVRREGALVLAEVEDNGPGVPELVRERIFEPFFTTKGQAGNGLGLWISSEIARTHGGSLQVGRGRLGGALFQLRLPAASWAGRERPAQAPASAPVEQRQ